LFIVTAPVPLSSNGLIASTRTARTSSGLALRSAHAAPAESHDPAHGVVHARVGPGQRHLAVGLDGQESASSWSLCRAPSSCLRYGSTRGPLDLGSVRSRDLRDRLLVAGRAPQRSAAR
jgi:hypothetical protein